MAEKNRTTNASLLERKFISQNAFDNVASLSVANRATLEAADAQVRLAQKALRDATVIAPITGIVAKKNVQDLPYMPRYVNSKLTECNTTNATGWPTNDNKYAFPASWKNWDNGIGLKELKPTK